MGELLNKKGIFDGVNKANIHQREFKKREIKKKWGEFLEEHGFTTEGKVNIALLMESEASRLLPGRSAADDIAYFENRVAGAREPEHKIRPMNQLITIMMVSIMKKHC